MQLRILLISLVPVRSRDSHSVPTLEVNIPFRRQFCQCLTAEFLEITGAGLDDGLHAEDALKCRKKADLFSLYRGDTFPKLDDKRPASTAPCDSRRIVEPV